MVVEIFIILGISKHGMNALQIIGTRVSMVIIGKIGHPRMIQMEMVLLMSPTFS